MKCPANNETCHKCGKKDTINLCVRQEKLYTCMEVDSDDKDTHLEVESDIFLGTLTTHSSMETNY